MKEKKVETINVSTKVKMIYYTLKYDGNYSRIANAFSSNEEINEKDAIFKKANEIQNVITILDKEYPKQLLELRYPPFCLFYKGDLSLLNKPMVGVIGTRTPDSYGIISAKTITEKLNAKQKVIVSGLNEGINAAVHQDALKPIAVLGNGIDYACPQENAKLYERIKTEGLLISEYPDNVKPIASNFQFRNRIIAALCEELYLGEIDINSSSTLLVETALELNKPLQVLPTEIYSRFYNNELLYEGAIPIVLGRI